MELGLKDEGQPLLDLMLHGVQGHPSKQQVLDNLKPAVTHDGNIARRVRKAKGLEEKLAGRRNWLRPDGSYPH